MRSLCFKVTLVIVLSRQGIDNAQRLVHIKLFTFDVGNQSHRLKYMRYLKITCRCLLENKFTEHDPL